jgi:formylmethanofuran dehydrogenase subunit C
LKNSNIYIEGTCSSVFGSKSQNCNFTIDGEVKEGLGYFSNNSTFEFYGNVDSFHGNDSEGSIYIFHGEVGNFTRSRTRQCYFMTSNIETYKKFHSESHLGDGSDRFFFMKSDDSLIELSLLGTLEEVK